MDLEFSISRELADRLFSLKAAQGRDDLTANEYAAELLKMAVGLLESETAAK
jgi:hypothetical protein